MIYFRFYLKAYDTATDECSMLEHGAYLALMRKYYKDEKPLPLNSDALARACRAISLEERAALAAMLDRFFVRRHDGWHNERADHEIEVSRKARENGSRGGRPSRDDDDDPPEPHGKTDHQTERETESVTEPETEQATGAVTGHGTESGQPFSLSTKTIHPTHQPSNQPPSAGLAAGGRRKPCETRETWEAYRAAHAKRYGIDPVRNARVNGQIASFVRCVGAAEAPAIAAFYLSHNRAAYVQGKHSTSFLARDAEGLRTEWATGQRVGETEARGADRTMATGNAFASLLREAER